MAIRWDPQLAHDALDRVEEILKEVMPHLARIENETKRSAKSIPNLPGYIKEPLVGMQHNIRWAVEKTQDRCDSIRHQIPNQSEYKGKKAD